MKLKLVIFLLFFSCFSMNAQEQTKYGEVNLNDSTFIYYFDFFNDHRSFEWGTVPKNFNFSNYRFYFKNNSEDTLWRGRVTTGDGRVTYHYAGHQQMILPNEYFIIQPMHNGSMQYRRGRFSRSVLMTAMIHNDSIVSNNHRFIGFYSEDTVLVNLPRIKLDEPLNPYPDGLETRIKQERYEQRMREYEERTAKRKLERMQQADSIQKVPTPPKAQPKRVVSPELYVRLTFSGRELDPTSNVFIERGTDLIQLDCVTKPEFKKHYKIENSENLEKIKLLVKSADGRTLFQEEVNTFSGSYIRIDLRPDGFSSNSSNNDEYFRKKIVQLKQQKFTISIVSEKVKNITNECEFQVFQDGKWVDVQMSYLDSGIGFFGYSTVVDDYRKQIRWKLKTADTWIEDWLYLKRYSHQIFTDPELVNMYGLTGRYNVEMLKNEYRFEHSYSSRDVFASGTPFLDSVKSVFRWYGIPYNWVNYESIKISKSEDLARTRRALRKHFGDVDLLPLLKKRHNQSDWLCGDLRIEFLPEVTNEEATKLLRSLGYRDFYVGTTKSYDGRIIGAVQIDTISALDFYGPLEKLYQQKELYSLKLNTCGIAIEDVPY